MTTLGFGPGTRDEFGCPLWIAELADDDPNHLVHVVCDLEPADALELLGADRQSIVPCELPAERPDERESLLRAAVRPLDPAAVMVAGRIGGWTFIYDDLGTSLFLFHLPERPPRNATQALSAKGKIAATSSRDINGYTSFEYAVDGTSLVYEESLDLAELDEDTPPELRAAVEAAGVFDPQSDEAVNMRVICALAGLPRTLDDLRRIPLLVAPLD